MPRLQPISIINIGICLFWTISVSSFVSAAAAAAVLPMEQEMAKFAKLRVPPEKIDKLKNFHENLYYGAVKALLGQLGKMHYKKVPEGERRRLAKCLDRLESRFDLVGAAKCLVESRERHLEWEELMREDEEEEEEKVASGKEANGWARKSANANDDQEGKGLKSKGFLMRRIGAFAQEEAALETMADGAKSRREFVRPVPIQGRPKTSWRLQKLQMAKKSAKKAIVEKPQKLSQILFGTTKSKPIMKMNRMEKYGGINWRRRAKREFLREKEDEAEDDGMDIEEMKNMRHKMTGMLAEMEGNEGERERPFQQMRRTNNVAPPLQSHDEKTIASRVSNLLLKAIGPKAEEAGTRWSKAQKTLERLAEQAERSKKFPGTRVYEKRMYDIVLDRDEPSLGQKDRRSPLGLLQEGIKLIEMMPSSLGKGTMGMGQQQQEQQGEQEQKQQNMRMFSPRFMPLAPDKGGPTHPNSLMSPTLLAMYEEKDNRSLANVPEMLKKAGVLERDRQGIIATLMELTGTTSHVEKALGILKDVDFFKEGVGHPLMKATDRILNAFFDLEDSLDGDQRKDCRQRGFTFATKSQVMKLLKDQAVDGSQLPAEELARFERYDRMGREEKENALWATVQQIAGIHPNKSSSSSAGGGGRAKRQTIRLHLFEPFILSPFQFAPTLGLTLFGPVILSPSTFSPYVLAPSLFSPLILSPPIFSPLVLSPSIASPWIVTPGVANPYIISPYIFGPFILGPLVLHPFVLSPYIISPNILNPYVLSPIVLNPIALSPDILSPQVLGGAVFSPAMLSPAILTQTYLMVSIFSPTFLS